jgi:hypothetical protein
MATFIDAFDIKLDNFIVLPRYEWRIMGMGKAKKPIRIIRFCKANCEFFKEDLDKYPLCYDPCKHWIFDEHIVGKGEAMINLLFAVNENDPHEGFSRYMGQKYLEAMLGDKHVKRMVGDYLELVKQPEDGYLIE